MRVATLAIAALALCAGRADAQYDHRLVVQGALGCGETTQELGVDMLDVSCESGVIGVDPNSYSNGAFADSATGHLAITAQLYYLEPPASFAPGNLDTIALIQERLTRTAPGPIRATLQFSAGLQVGGTPVDYEATLSLNNTCRAFFSQTVGNGFIDPPSEVASCPTAGTASVDSNTLTVTLESNVTTIDLLAQIRADWLFLFDLGGQYQIGADLRVEALDGASFSAPSPTFLTQVPEPGVTLAGVASLAATAMVTRWRR